MRIQMGPLRMQLQLSPASCQHHQCSLQSPPVVINSARQGCDGGGGMDYTTLGVGGDRRVQTEY